MEDALVTTQPILITVGTQGNRRHAVAGRAGRFGAGWQELVEGACSWRIWHLIGIGDLRRRYARSRMGQLWLTLSSGLSIAIIGVMWSLLWKVSLSDMLPFLAVSMVIWQFLSGIITDATTVFSANARYLLSQRVACSSVVFGMIYRHLLILLHNALIVSIVFLAFSRPLSLQVLLVFPALLLTAISALWLGYLLGTLCARFRDLVHAVHSLLQLAFYITPVIWKPEFLPEHVRWLQVLNPFAVYIGIIRDPLLGEPISSAYWLVAAGIAFGGFALSLPFIGRYRRRLLYWV